MRRFPQRGSRVEQFKASDAGRKAADPSLHMDRRTTPADLVSGGAPQVRKRRPAGDRARTGWGNFLDVAPNPSASGGRDRSSNMTFTFKMGNMTSGPMSEPPGQGTTPEAERQARTRRIHELNESAINRQIFVRSQLPR